MKTQTALQIAAAAAAATIGLIVSGSWNARTATAAAADDWAALPQSVRAAFEAQRPGEIPSEIEFETEGGRDVYEAEYRSAKGNADITVDATGKLVVVKTKVKAAELPEAIRKALDAKYPGARIREAEATNLGYYELDLRVDGKKIEVVVQKDGTVGINPEEDDADGEVDDDGTENG